MERQAGSAVSKAAAGLCCVASVIVCERFQPLGPTADAVSGRPHSNRRGPAWEEAVVGSGGRSSWGPSHLFCKGLMVSGLGRAALQTASL